MFFSSDTVVPITQIYRMSAFDLLSDVSLNLLSLKYAFLENSRSVADLPQILSAVLSPADPSSSYLE